MEDPIDSPMTRRFVEITLPALVKEMARMNDNVERALDYYAVEGRVPDKDKESS